MNIFLYRYIYILSKYFEKLPQEAVGRLRRFLGHIFLSVTVEPLLLYRMEAGPTVQYRESDLFFSQLTILAPPTPVVRHCTVIIATKQISL